MKKIIQHKNAFLAYYIYGSGIPLILIHGFAETNTIWKKQVVYLSNYCTVIIPDLPGSGESQLPDLSGKNLTIDDLSDSIFSIIENENLETCIMLGHSMGGYVALDFAEKHPEKLNAFGFVHSTAFADSEEKKQNRLRGIEMLGSYGSYVFLKTSIPGLFAEAFKKENPSVVTQLIEEGRKFNKDNLKQYYYAMIQRPDKRHVIKNSKLPVLFVIGTDDIAAPLNDVMKQVYLPEIAYIHIVENTGHMSMLEAPDELNSTLKNFVNACV